MWQKIIIYFLSILCFLVGISLLFFEGPVYSKGFKIPPLGGISFVFFGLMGIWSTRTLDKNIIKTTDGEQVFKCVACGKIVTESEKNETNTCLNCEGELENLEGFFERHPEFLDKDKE